ncbi:MAG: helix-turn-helix transcriptional regulator [Alphaproteobacteria bacterium]|jgi:phage repressor protein C with HTH and peptisase S24 domain|nr:DNA-binding protein [Rhodospirillaceae bacterium]MDP6407004.1 helix-turn-helix transcriptional regulator [Alphaproteobacteria bacterium]MDP6624710.1 helix-turn-helix transcriptional regulator [Alphaproteobacteria bacterium]|tara:strand:+ start:532 stop:1164 length:633 start_codon:yes stop_codon:yes gene_type:complete
MLSHGGIWRAIDALAQRNELSASGLALKAGLDATTFNPSKRTTSGTRLRWPSTESVAKVLQATGWTFSDFIALTEEDPGLKGLRRVPLLGLAKAGNEGFFDDAGYPSGHGWDEVVVADIADPGAYALKISGNSMMPVYRDGDFIIVSPASRIRRGDRVVVKTRDGEVMAKELRRKSAARIDLHSFNSQAEDRLLATGDVEWIARIVWVSQ